MYMCDAICNIFGVHYQFSRKVSRERSISTPSIINSVTSSRDRTYSEESRFSRSQSPHSRTAGTATPTTSILDAPTWGNTACYVCVWCIRVCTIVHVHNRDTYTSIFVVPPPPLSLSPSSSCSPRLSHLHTCTNACTFVVHIIVHRLCWVPVLPILKEQGAMANLSGSACLVKPPTRTPPWSNTQCHHPPLIVGMLPWPVQRADSPPRNINGGYVVNIIGVQFVLCV